MKRQPAHLDQGNRTSNTEDVPTQQNLIFDIGMHNGDDSAYYLHLGYSVVGVDANPLLTAKCALRFENETREGRITVINAGILGEPGEFTFYRNLLDDGHSSFDPEKGKQGGKWEAMTIPCTTSQQLIEAYGKPHFMKVDIEGADLQAIEPITPATAPNYLSLELSSVDAIMKKLFALGYSSFKFVNGETYRPTHAIFGHQVGWRILRKARRANPVIRRMIDRLPQHLGPKFSSTLPPSIARTDICSRAIVRAPSGSRRLARG